MQKKTDLLYIILFYLFEFHTFKKLINQSYIMFKLLDQHLLSNILLSFKSVQNDEILYIERHKKIAISCFETD